MFAKKSQPADDSQEPTFEDRLAEVEQIVADLEEGQIGLEESLEQYERGVKLLRECFGALENAERKIELLSRVDGAGQPETTPFDDEQLAPEEKAGARSRRRTAGRRTPQATEVDESEDPI